MTDTYALQQVGVVDGTVNPPVKADGRQVNARNRIHICSKHAVDLAAGDRMFLCRKPAGQKITNIRVCTDTSFGSSTIAIGVTGTSGKYVAARTFTTPTDAPTSIGPKASTLDDDPGAEEDIWLTVAAATLAGTTLATFIIEMAGA